MVRPHLEYGNVVWHPYLKKDVDLLERVQRRATKLIPVLSKLSYEGRLKEMDLPSLVYRRIRGDSIDIYKYLHGMPSHFFHSPSQHQGWQLEDTAWNWRNDIAELSSGPIHWDREWWISGTRCPRRWLQQSQLTPSRDIVTNAVLQSATAWMWMKFSLWWAVDEDRSTGNRAYNDWWWWWWWQIF